MLVNKEIFDFEHTYVRLHENFVSYYANALCEALEIDPYRVNIAAFYHDHGKYKWPKDLFTKSKLDKADWQVIKRHPSDSIEVIFKTMPDRRNEFLRGDPSIADLILMHHEKPDGSGYYGIKDIPVEVAILSISDIFDACLSDRTYRKGMDIETSICNALVPFTGYLNAKGYDTRYIEKVLRKSAMKFKFEKVR